MNPIHRSRKDTSHHSGEERGTGRIFPSRASRWLVAALTVSTVCFCPEAAVAQSTGEPGSGVESRSPVSSGSPDSPGSLAFPDSPTPPDGPELSAPPADIECPLGHIGEVVIDNHSVFDLPAPGRLSRFEWAYRLANAFHMRTEEQVIANEILLRPGDCYDPNTLSDSEHLLRAMSFISDASIYGIRMPDGTVQLRVDTRDEWSTRVRPAVRIDGNIGLKGLWITEDNLLGTGNHLEAFFDDGPGEAEFGVSYYNPQVLGSRWDLTLSGAQTGVGYSFHQSAVYPFVGETGRFAFRQTIERRDQYFELLVPWENNTLGRIWVPEGRNLFEVGAAVRWGQERYHHTVLGAAVVGERVRYPEDELPVSDPPEVGSAPLPVEWYPASSVRLVLVTGQRNAYFVRRHAIDTVNGNEDVLLGAEAEVMLGPTLPISRDQDMMVGVRLATSGEPMGSVLLGGDVSFEGRRISRDTRGLPEWQDVIAEGNVWGYARPGPGSRHLFVGAVAALGGWRSRGPFQLSLGEVSGLRGFPRHADPGGQRVVGSLEYRTYLGWPYRDLFDTGTVVFLDAGRIWPGNAPFGESVFRTSAGIGLRTAFPPGSRQTFRLDIGFPLTHRTDSGGITVSIGMGQTIGRMGTRNVAQLDRSIRYRLSISDFESRGLAP
ncbi:MAG: BamA/TamA family outer membrane protein [Gemmatimonadota bacterium]|nr:BamA/TamA family outer membrane protein [Gemmatimonadota bacterium]